MTSPRLSNLDLVVTCDNFPYGEGLLDTLYQLYLPHDDRPHGYMFPGNVHHMPWSADFEINHEDRTVKLKDTFNGQDPATACTAAFAKVVNEAIEQGTFALLHQKHSELFPILGAKYEVNFERFAGDLFGFTARGAHLTVYTNTKVGMRIWVPKRSPNMFTYPNKLDTTVAGGVPSQETPFQNIVREAQEEASLPADLIETGVRATGVLTYMSYSQGQADKLEPVAVPDVVYVFDLEVGPDVTPIPEDGEVKEFYLMSVDEIQEALSRGEFKTNSAVVMIDFFIRHGIITPDNEQDYVDIMMRMHRRLPFPTSPEEQRGPSLSDLAHEAEKHRHNSVV